MDRASQSLRLIDCGEPAPLVDRQVAARLRARLGERAAEEVLEDAIFEITEGLFAIETALAAGDMARCGRIARRMSADAASIGLTALSIAAREMAEAAERGDAELAKTNLFAIAENSLIAAAISGART